MKMNLIRAGGDIEEVEGNLSIAPLAKQTLEEAFPELDAGVAPLGNRILVQIRSPKLKTTGGIILTDESQDYQKWNEMTAKIIALGPLAFRKRDTLEMLPEGQWCGPGDFVRVPKYGGDRWERTVEGIQGLFVIFNDHEIISKVTCNPLDLEVHY